MKRCALILLVILTLLLAACGGEEQSQEAETAGVQPPAAAEAAEEIPATAVPPTAEPAAPTDEPPAAATEPMPQPTPEPTATAEPQPAASEDGWGESGTNAQSACDHPYFPLREGYAFTMSSADGEDMRWEVISVEGDMDQATAEMEMTFADFQFTYTWDCSASGGLVSYDFSNPSLSAIDPGAEIIVTAGSGSFLPPVEELTPGATWESGFDSELSITQVEGDEEIEVAGTIRTTQLNEVVNDEPAAYDGRQVPAILVHQDLALSMVMTMMGTTIENEMEMAGEVLFGRGIGILQQTSFSEFGDFTSELIDVYVP
jgi:hypothetical protein